jgi:hypothetical protein
MTPSSYSPIFAQFGISGQPEILYGGSQPIFRVGDVVFKHIAEESLENNGSPQISAWISSFSVDLPQEGFRVPRPLPDLAGRWLTPDGWTAMTWLPGQPAGAHDLPACIAALQAFHQALRHLPIHPQMQHNQTAWGKADRWCWGSPPAKIQPELRALVSDLYALRKPIPTQPLQIIHGDPGPNNFLIEPGLTPAILDLSPFWGSPDFSLAMLANFAGPRLGDITVLEHFRAIPYFNQLLIRAALRMLLVVSALNGLDDWTTERRAAEMVIEYVRTSHV